MPRCHASEHDVPAVSMTPRTRRVLAEPASRSARERYGVALLLTATSLLVTVGLLEASDEPIYGVLLGALAVSAWYGGFGPAVASLVVGWVAAYLWLGPRGE